MNEIGEKLKRFFGSSPTPFKGEGRTLGHKPPSNPGNAGINPLTLAPTADAASSSTTPVTRASHSNAAQQAAEARAAAAAARMTLAPRSVPPKRADAEPAQPARPSGPLPQAENSAVQDGAFNPYAPIIGRPSGQCLKQVPTHSRDEESSPSASSAALDGFARQLPNQDLHGPGAGPSGLAPRAAPTPSAAPPVHTTAQSSSGPQASPIPAPSLAHLGPAGHEAELAFCSMLSAGAGAETWVVLSRLLGNVVAHPGDDKYRTLRLGNARIRTAVVEVAGGLELLQALGFQVAFRPVASEAAGAGATPSPTTVAGSTDGVRDAGDAATPPGNAAGAGASVVVAGATNPVSPPVAEEAFAVLSADVAMVHADLLRAVTSLCDYHASNATPRPSSAAAGPSSSSSLAPALPPPAAASSRLPPSHASASPTASSSSLPPSGGLSVPSAGVSLSSQPPVATSLGGPEQGVGTGGPQAPGNGAGAYGARVVDRQMRVFLPSEFDASAHVELPDSFFEASAAERLADHQQGAKKRAESQQLTTRAYKEQQRLARHDPSRYKYALVRVRFPDNCVLQGVFAPAEPVTNIYEWVSEHLCCPHLPFDLYLHPSRKPLSIHVTEGAKGGASTTVRPRTGGSVAGAPVLATLRDAELVPAAVINFRPGEEAAHVHAGRSEARPGSRSFLREELVRQAETLGPSV
eukprot:jgi/Mesvir1/5014/Mv13899-RA.1